ncbi:MAG: YHYH protein [Actinomycetota bacterium]
MIPTRTLRTAAVLTATSVVALMACGSDDDASVAESHPAAEEADGGDHDHADDEDHDHADGEEHDHEHDEDTEDDAADGEETSDESSDTSEDSSLPSSLSSAWTGSYELIDEEFGTMVTVTVDGDTRSIESNTLPDHETGEFPNAGNPNAISEQDRSWEFAATGVDTGTITSVREFGVAVNGVKFEPGTGESVTCASGENYRIEALQDVYDLGLDFNNAHVQPDGEYHYHGISELLVDGYDSDQDLVHIGFAADGNLVYYSKSGAYSPSYVLTDDARTGTDCVASGPDGTLVDIDGSAADGTYTSDFVFDESAGDLDECNGITIDGQYVYLATDTFPFIGRCVMGEVSGDAVGGGGGGTPPGGENGGAEAGGGQTGAPPDAPDFAEAAAALGITEDELIDALGSPPDVDQAAEILGISVEELTGVLPPPPGG